MSEEQSAPYKVTLKAGEGYAEPWVTVEGRNEAELAFNLKDLVEKGTFVLVSEAAAALKQATHGVQTAAQTLGAQVQQGAQSTQPIQNPYPQQQQQYTQPQQGNVVQGNFGQQQQQQPQGDRMQPLQTDYVGKGGHWPPAGPRPNCQHGPRDWKSFVAKSGKLTEMWACPFDRKDAFIPPGQSKCDVEWADKR